MLLLSAINHKLLLILKIVRHVEEDHKVHADEEDLNAHSASYCVITAEGRDKCPKMRATAVQSASARNISPACKVW